MPLRREFLKSLGWLSASLAMPLSLQAVTTTAQYQDSANRLAPVRIRGKVSANGKGLKGVPVTDGYSVVQTNDAGTYELLSNRTRDFVYITLPAGYTIPTHSNGTARFYQPLPANDKNELTAHFELKPSPVREDKHVLLVLADPQIQNRYEADRFLQETVPDVSALVKTYGERPVFGVGCGDLVFDEFALFADYQKAVSGMGIPFFQVLGNHDMDTQGVRSDALSSRTFKSLFGPTYYSFNRGEVHYVVLEDVFFVGASKQYIGYLTEEQLRWLEQDLALVEKGKTVVVSLHIPAFTGASRRSKETESLGGVVANRQELYRLLEPFKAHLMSGHTHFNEKVLEGGVIEHVHGTVCGAWWSGPICYDGTPNGYGVYEVNGSTIQWYYKSTGKDRNHQMRCYAPGTNPHQPSQLTVNAWNADPDWKLSWYEDGIRKGQLRRETGLDPLSVELHTGNEKPQRRPWVEPQLTDHLYLAILSEGVRRVTVEATDRFGKTYSESLEIKKA
jgi:hypothetical protein